MKAGSLISCHMPSHFSMTHVNSDPVACMGAMGNVGKRQQRDLEPRWMATGDDDIGDGDDDDDDDDDEGEYDDDTR